MRDTSLEHSFGVNKWTATPPPPPPPKHVFLPCQNHERVEHDAVVRPLDQSRQRRHERLDVAVQLQSQKATPVSETTRVCVWGGEGGGLPRRCRRRPAGATGPAALSPLPRRLRVFYFQKKNGNPTTSVLKKRALASFSAAVRPPPHPASYPRPTIKSEREQEREGPFFRYQQWSNSTTPYCKCGPRRFCHTTYWRAGSASPSAAPQDQGEV